MNPSSSSRSVDIVMLVPTDSASDIQVWSRQLQSVLEKSHQKSQQLRSDCAQSRIESQQMRYDCSQERLKFQQLRSDCAQERQKSQQLRSGSNRRFQESVQLQSDSDVREQAIEQLPANPNEHFLMLMQLQSDSDGRLERIEQLQSHVNQRLLMIEQLQSLVDYVMEPTACVSASNVSSESAYEADLKTVLENLQGLIDKFVTGDWSDVDEFAASDPQRGSLAAMNFSNCTHLSCEAIISGTDMRRELPLPLHGGCDPTPRQQYLLVCHKLESSLDEPNSGDGGESFSSSFTNRVVENIQYYNL